MKSLKLVLSITTLALVAGVPLLRAVDGDAEPTKAKRERPDGDRRGMGEGALRELAEKLNLTEEQKAKIGEIHKSRMDKFQALMEDTNLEREERRAKMQEIQQSSREQIRALLTPEQQKIFDEMPERGPGKRGEGRRKKE